MSLSPALRPKSLLWLLPALLLAACDNGGGSHQNAQYLDAAVVATRTASYDGGAVSLVASDAPYSAQNNLPPNDTSDLLVRSGGDHYFVLQRYGSDRILRYDAAHPQTPVYNYSTQLSSENQDSNPADLIIAGPHKAYLLRYGAGTLWIVDPEASSEATFKIGEIDLSQYDVDGIPDMTAGLIQNGKLYVAMQRLENYNAVKSSYIAVIDTATDQEIATGASGDATLKGIELPVRNVSSLSAIPGKNRILAVAPGDYGSYPDYLPSYNGGVVAIDSGSYQPSLLIDDGDTSTHPYGQLTDLVVASADRAYLIGSTGFGADQTLYRFNPDDASPAPVTVNGYANLSLGALAVDPTGNLWLSRTDDSAPGLSVIAYANGSETTLKSLIDTNLVPINIDFVTVPSATQ